MDFFPTGAFDVRPDLHQFRNNWYVSHLLAMREEPLYPPSADQTEVYRLTYLPTFEHPTVVRVTRAVNRGWAATCKRTDGRGGYGAGQLVAQAVHSLSQAEVQEFHDLLGGSGFWEMPSFEDDAGCDGSQDILEGVRAGVYHVVDRWSPHGTPYAKLTGFMLRLCPANITA